MNLLRKYKISKEFPEFLEERENEIITFIKNRLRGLSPTKNEDNPDSIFYINKYGDCVLEDKKVNIYLLVKYDVLWDALENEYLMNYTDIQDILKYMIEEVLKTKVKPPCYNYLMEILREKNGL